MKTGLTATIAAIAAVLATAPVAAKTFTYACSYREDSEQYTRDPHLHSVKHDTSKGTLTVMGKVYKNMKQVACEAKACFGNDRVTLELSTQGGASLSILVGTAPGGDGVDQLDCSQLVD